MMERRMMEKRMMEGRMMEGCSPCCQVEESVRVNPMESNRPT